MDFSISLKRVDGVANERDCVLLKPGKTVIGRGPILKCTDTRVSRNHAILDVDEEDKLLTLTSTHVNPCFYKSVDDDNFVTLNKNKSQVLAYGDKFSLLPSCLIYEVVIKNENSAQPEISNGDTMKCEDDADVDVTVTEFVPLEHNKVSEVTTMSTQRKRILPDWLQNIDSDEESNSTSKASKKPVNKKATKQPRASNSTSTSSNQQTKKQSVLPASTSATSSKNVSKEDNEKSKTVKRQLSTDDDSQENKPQPEAKVDKVTKKKKCPYGSKCYRKNPVHFEEFNHDDASDNENASDDDDDDDDDDDKPECEYGLDCYRKNPQHLKDFKHTKRIRQAVKKTAAKTRRRDDDEDNSDDESNDSFVIDDDDSDDYKPESESETDDELHVLLKEADEFKKNKKMINPNA